MREKAPATYTRSSVSPSIQRKSVPARIRWAPKARLQESAAPTAVVGTRWSSASVSELRSAAWVEKVLWNSWKSVNTVAVHSLPSPVRARAPVANDPASVLLNWSRVPLSRLSS